MFYLYITLYNMKKYLHILASLWVPEKSAKIYLVLLNQGWLNVTQIASKSLCTRMDVYAALKILWELHLVKPVLLKKRKIYVAQSPEVLSVHMEQLHNQQKSMLDELSRVFDRGDDKIEVTIHEWEEGLRAVFADMMHTWKYGDTVYRISSELDTERVDTFIPQNYRAIRTEKGVSLYLITPDRVAKNKKQRLDRSIAIIPERTNEFSNNLTMTLYGDKLAYMDFNTLSACIIHGESLVDFHKKIFRLLFRQLWGS